MIIADEAMPRNPDLRVALRGVREVKFSLAPSSVESPLGCQIHHVHRHV